MSDRAERRIAFGLCLLVVLGTVAPYFVAVRLAQPNAFTGFLINPIDGFSYLAKMHQGSEGEWLFCLPYASDPGSAVFIFGYYLFLGHIADFLHIPLLTLFHLARALAAIGMFWLGFLFFRLFLRERFERWAAFLLSLFGAGMGWLFGLFGIETSDLSIPESIPFQTAYANAHFPFANLLLLAAAVAIVREGNLRWRVIAAGLCGLLLSLVLPFSLASLVVFLGLWLAWESAIILRAQDWQAVWSHNKAYFIPFGGLLAGAGPLLLYEFWLTKSHPVISLWNSQNQTPSPPVTAYLIGYSPVLLLAIGAIFHPDGRKSSRNRLLLVWVVSNALLLYAPFNLQRRLTLGLYFPMACLAAIGLRCLFQNPARQRLVLIAVIIVVIPSNLLLVLTGIDRVKIADPAFIHRPGEVLAYEWLSEHIPKGSLILAAADTGNRLPAYADVRVLYGHPFETPDAEQKEALVDELLRWDGPGDEGMQRLISLGVDYVFFGTREMEIGTPTWLSMCSIIYETQEIQILQVIDS
jgi:hypothetical protein